MTHSTNPLIMIIIIIVTTKVPSLPATLHKTRHRASTPTRWHFAFGLCCRSN